MWVTLKEPNSLQLPAQLTPKGGPRWIEFPVPSQESQRLGCARFCKVVGNDGFNCASVDVVERSEAKYIADGQYRPEAQERVDQGTSAFLPVLHELGERRWQGLLDGDYLANSSAQRSTLEAIYVKVMLDSFPGEAP
jgi:hypothetical protein